MKVNIGALDRMTRIMIAAIIGAIYFMQLINGATAVIAVVLAFVFILTGLIGTCPLYLPFGIHTHQKKTKNDTRN